MTYQCPDIRDVAGDGCCVDWCAVTDDDVRCMIMSLLPPGEMFRADRDTNIRRFFDALATAVHAVIQRVCEMIRESDPCTAEHTLDDWMEIYGVGKLCRIIAGCSDADAVKDIRRQLVCIMSELEYGAVVNCCFYQRIGELIGVEVCCVPEPRINSWYWSPGCESCQDEPQRYPFYSSPDFTPNPGCPDPRGDSCCEDEPVQYAIAGCMNDCSMLCEHPEIPEHTAPDGITPTVVIFELRPQPGHDKEFIANCSLANDSLCFNPLVAAMECVIQSTLPEGVHACIVRV